MCEIETDKATMGFETPEEGYLAKIIIQAGTKDIPIGKLLCIIVETKEDIEKFKDFVDDGSSAVAPAAAAPTPAPAAPSPPPASAPPPVATAPPPAAPPVVAPPPAVTPSGLRAFASPAAKRVAAERGVDLSMITKGSGMDGMITSRLEIECDRLCGTCRVILCVSGTWKHFNHLQQLHQRSPCPAFPWLGSLGLMQITATQTCPTLGR